MKGHNAIFRSAELEKFVAALFASPMGTTTACRNHRLEKEDRNAKPARQRFEWLGMGNENKEKCNRPHAVQAGNVETRRRHRTSAHV